MTLHQSAAWVRTVRSTAALEPFGDAVPRAPAAPTISLGEVASALRRRWLPLALWLALCLALAGWYLHTAATEFTASATVLLEPRRPAGPPPPPAVQSVVQVLDVAQAESQIQVIRSERVLAAVFDTLDLERAPELAARGPGLRDRVAAMLGRADTAPPMPADTKARAYQAFEERVSVRRLGQSYVLEVSYRAGSPDQAARIANAVTAQYLKAQIDTKAAAAEQGTEYLQGRITALKAEQAAALQGVRDGRIPDMQFSDADARVIGAALRPLGKSSPKTGLILAFALTFGGLSGLLAVAARHALDRTFRRRQQVWPALGVECVGVLPKLPRPRGGRAPQARTALLEQAVSDPASPFAQAFRAVRTSILPPDRRRCAIGIVSWSPGEGRTTVAANLAAVMAVAREAVALIDGDVRNPALTRARAPEGTSDTDATRSGPGAPDLPATAREPGTPMLVSVAGVDGACEADGDLGSTRMRDFFARLRTTGDMVFDLPPLGTSPDALALASCLDGIVLVIEAGRTTIEEAAEVVRAMRAVGIPVLGAILNKAEPVAERSRRRARSRP